MKGQQNIISNTENVMRQNSNHQNGELRVPYLNIQFLIKNLNHLV